MKLLLFGNQAPDLREVAEGFNGLEVVDDAPDVVVCYGGDGTLLAAELEWPGIPKLPIRNSRRGHRLIPHSPEDVFARLTENRLARTEFTKLACVLQQSGKSEPLEPLTAMNEFNVHMGNMNTAVRFQLWINGEAYGDGVEIIGDGLVISTPFGSTAYFEQITRGVFHVGLGIAFKNASERISHIITSEDARVRVLITRGPAGLARDNARDHLALNEGDELLIQRHAQPAVLYTWHSMTHPSDDF
jgi:NAD+ kinase